MKLVFENIKQEIAQFLESSDKEICIAVSWLTDRKLFNILLKKLQSGVKVSLITRNDFLNNHPGALPWNLFIDSGGVLRFCQPGHMLHYKFAVSDNRAALATSCNWTCFAGNNNRENLMMFRDVETIRTFMDEFTYLSGLFPAETHTDRISPDKVDPRLKGFYDITLADDEKFQDHTSGG